MMAAPMTRYRDSDVVDAVVIGTGAGGAPILSRLAERGLRVVALEAGQHWTPAAHTADEVAAGSLYWPGERLSGGADPVAFGGNNAGIGVGGSTLHWGAFCPRPNPQEFQLHTLTGQGHDWPIAHAALTPYYEAVERFIGVSGPAQYPWDASRRYLLPPVARNAPAQAMAKGCAALGIAATDAPAAVLSREWAQPAWGRRLACVNCGACHQGCRNGAKASMDVTYLPLAVAHGAEIRADSMVCDLERDGAGRVTGVVYRRDGQIFRQACAHVFLCAGGIETPRLLLNLGLANSSLQVGRNFMAHIATQVWGRFGAEMRMNHGYPSALISEDMARLSDMAGGYLLQSLGVMPVTLATAMVRGAGLWGDALVDHLDHYNHLAGLGINGECLPYDGNRLVLSDETDEAGLRKARIDFSFGDNERSIDRHAQQTMRAIWKAAGAEKIFSIQRTAHTIGTCRMGTDRAQAVVDPDGKSFDIDNLWICDNSVFPSALSANPALTIMALALRCADRFLATRSSG